MIYRNFGKTGWKVSAIGQGCWNIGNQWGELTDSEAESVIRAGYDNGINLFDVAEVYGNPCGLSEIRLGKALKGIRDKVYIVSKLGLWGSHSGQTVPKTTPDMIRLCGHACAGRLNTQWVDVMLCHEANVSNPEVYIEGFEALKKEGFIREYGISTDSLDVLKRFYDLSDGNCKVVELNYTLLNTDPEKEMLPFCMENGIGILAKTPLASGMLSGKFNANTVFEDKRKKWNKDGSDREYFEEKLSVIEKIKTGLNNGNDISSTALRFIMSHPASPIPIPGATKPDHTLKNAKAGDALLSAEELQVLRNCINS